MSKPSKITTEIRDQVAHVRLARPERRNALDGEMLLELRDAVAGVAGDRKARVVVLGGEGPAFSAGADIDWMRREGAATPEENRRSALELARLYELIDTLPLPLIARVHGPAIGGGVGLVAVCDVAVAARTAFFSLSEVRLGLVPAVVGPYVVAKIGASRAREVFLSGRRFSAEEALAWGLIHRIAPIEELDAAVAEAAGDLLRGGPEALARAKALIRSIAGERPDRAAGITADAIAAARAGREAQEGLEAFLKKAAPPWAPGGEGEDAT